jgi:hypothetical protein
MTSVVFFDKKNNAALEVKFYDEKMDPVLRMSIVCAIREEILKFQEEKNGE